MLHTALLEAILDKATAVQNEFNSQYLCASHIAVAVADFCRTAYTGFSLSDATYHPYRFEEERLRYIFSKEIKLASYFRTRLSVSARNGEQEEAFDLALCEHIAAQRGAEVLSSDVVFLCAVKELPQPYKATVKSVESNDSILALLQDADANVSKRKPMRQPPSWIGSPPQSLQSRMRSPRCFLRTSKKKVPTTY